MDKSESKAVSQKIDIFSRGSVQARYPSSPYRVKNFDNFEKQLQEFSESLREFFAKPNEQIQSVVRDIQLDKKPNKETECGTLRSLVQDICDVRIYFDDRRQEVETGFSSSNDKLVKKILAAEVLFNQNNILALAYIYFLFERKISDQVLDLLAKEKSMSAPDQINLKKYFRDALIYYLMNVKDVEMLERALEDYSNKLESDIKNIHQDLVTKLIDRKTTAIEKIFEGTAKKNYNIRDLFLAQDLCRTQKDLYDILTDYYLQALDEYIEQVLFWGVPRWNLTTLADLSLDDCSRVAKAMTEKLPSSQSIIDANSDIIETSKIISKDMYDAIDWMKQL